MKAMIFAAGLGTRLRPLTDEMPKALIPVAGVPMLERVIRKMIAAGVDDITVNVHHFSEKIIDFLRSNDDFGITIHVSDESGRLLDTGGGILYARHRLDGNEPFIVHNADILTDIDIAELYRRHIATGADATLLVSPRVTSRYLIFDENNRLRGWTNTGTGEVRPEGFVVDVNHHKQLAFGGVHVVSPTIFPSLEVFSSDAKFSIIPYYLSVCSTLKICGYTPERAFGWHDIGKPASLLEAEKAVNAGLLS